jgi:uncharacterized protein YutE (UPF0331/DUF86 family)/predicted nucleotidyltransferase
MTRRELDILKRLFRTYSEIKLAYLFGSRARLSGGPLSDYDFAVYLGGMKCNMMFSFKLDLIARISRILKSDRVDIVILNLTKSPELKYVIVKEGILLLEREPFKVMVEPKILNEYFDFQKTLSKYGLTKSFGMSNIRAIENKISSARKCSTILKRYKGFTKEKIRNNTDIRGAVERYLYLEAQAVIDLAEAVIAHNDFRKPTTMSESFYILNEEKFISAKLTEKLVRMVGFRNVLAHDYEDIDYDIVYNVLQKGLMNDIEAFLKIISKKLNITRPGKKKN